MVRLIVASVFFCCLVSSSSVVMADTIIKKGKLMGSLTFSPGYLVKEDKGMVSLHGFVQYFVSDRLALRAGGFGFLTGLSENEDIQHNHQGFLGLFYHLPLGSFVPYIGVQPGFGLFQAQDGCCTSPLRVSPLVSGTVGMSYMGKSWFFAFLEAKYVYGVSTSAGFRLYDLSECKVSFGLGGHW